MTAPQATDPVASLDRLAETWKAATPGPWVAATAPAEGSDETHAEYLTNALRPDEGRPLWVTWAPVVEGLHDDSDYVVPVVTGDGPTSEANARFVAEAHATVPALIAAVCGVLALAEDLDGVAERYEAEARGLAAPIARGEVSRRAAARIRSAVTAALGAIGGEQ